MKKLLLSLFVAMLVCASLSAHDGPHPFCAYWRDNRNFPAIYSRMSEVDFLDKRSIVCNSQKLSECCLSIEAVRVGHYGFSEGNWYPERFLFRYEDGLLSRMWLFSVRDNDWHYLNPHGSTLDVGLVLEAGEAAFHVKYGKPFYGVGAGRCNEDFYRRLDGLE